MYVSGLLLKSNFGQARDGSMHDDALPQSPATTEGSISVMGQCHHPKTWLERETHLIKSYDKRENLQDVVPHDCYALLTQAVKVIPPLLSQEQVVGLGAFFPHLALNFEIDDSI